LNKTISTKIQQNRNFQSVWETTKSDYVPLEGELIVFEAEKTLDGTILDNSVTGREHYTFPRIKVGDGVTNVMDLPFASSGVQIVTWED